MIWNNVNLVAKALPPEWNLLLWGTDGDEYNFFILKEIETQKFLELASAIGVLCCKRNQKSD